MYFIQFMKKVVQCLLTKINFLFSRNQTKKFKLKQERSPKFIKTKDLQGKQIWCYFLAFWKLPINCDELEKIWWKNLLLKHNLSNVISCVLFP